MIKLIFGDEIGTVLTKLCQFKVSEKCQRDSTGIIDSDRQYEKTGDCWKKNNFLNFDAKLKKMKNYDKTDLS